MEEFLQWAKSPKGIIILLLAGGITLFLVLRRAGGAGGLTPAAAAADGATASGVPIIVPSNSSDTGTNLQPTSTSADGQHDGSLPPGPSPTPAGTPAPPACTGTMKGGSYTVTTTSALKTLNQVFAARNPGAISCASAWNPSAARHGVGVNDPLWNGFVVYY